MKNVVIITPCYNEEANVELLVDSVKKITAPFESKYKFKHIFIDNDSKDRTVEILKNIATSDPS